MIAPTLADVLARAQTTQQIIATKVMLMGFCTQPDAALFVNTCRDALELNATELSSTRDQIHTYSEDQLTDKVVHGLRMLGLSARREQSTNGHVDITVEGHFELRWLAEAKIYTSYVNLLQGFRQLCSRYSTGISGQDHGALLIYFKQSRVLPIMKNWDEYIRDIYEDMSTQFCAHNPLAFDSTHAHESTALPYHVRHIPVTLYYEPTDATPAPTRTRSQAST